MDSPFLLLVCGGRDYADRDRVFEVLDAVASKHPNITILHGAASGADAIAEEWAKERGHPYIGEPRGQVVQLCYLPHGAVCFSGGNAQVANDAGISVWSIG